MKGLDWRKAQIAGKRKTSILDENEWRGQDAAARWLGRHDKQPRKPSKRTKLAEVRA